MVVVGTGPGEPRSWWRQSGVPVEESWLRTSASAPLVSPLPVLMVNTILAQNPPWRLPDNRVLFLKAIPGTLLRRRCPLGKGLLELLRKRWPPRSTETKRSKQGRRERGSQVP